MQKNYLAFLLFFIVYPPVFAQLLGPDPYYRPNSQAKDLEQVKRPERESVTSGSEELDDIALSRQEKGELSLSATEIRENHVGSLALGVGTTDAWQALSIMGSFFYSRDVHFGGAVGGGAWRFTGAKGGRRYEIETNAFAIEAFGKYFFTDRTPFFLQSGLGLVALNGDVKPIGGDGLEDSSQSEANDSLRSGFRTTGVFLSQQLGWQTNWESGLLFEISIVGFGHTQLMQRTFTRSAAGAKRAVNEELEGFSSWGLLNAKLGWLF
jgi:hypothetical protein